MEGDRGGKEKKDNVYSCIINEVSPSLFFPRTMKYRYSKKIGMDTLAGEATLSKCILLLVKDMF